MDAGGCGRQRVASHAPCLSLTLSRVRRRNPRACSVQPAHVASAQRRALFGFSRGRFRFAALERDPALVEAVRHPVARMRIPLPLCAERRLSRGARHRERHLRERAGYFVGYADHRVHRFSRSMRNAASRCLAATQFDKGRLAESVPEWRGGALLLDARYSRRRLPAAEGRAFVDVCAGIPEAHCA
ncbi:hypothetical protein WS86_07390 [Burkholderia savannae]|nr:hypothetical protein WS86_07390 [Burkholderia savannae]